MQLVVQMEKLNSLTEKSEIHTPKRNKPVCLPLLFNMNQAITCTTKTNGLCDYIYRGSLSCMTSTYTTKTTVLCVYLSRCLLSCVPSA